MVGESEEKNCPATDFQLISQFSQYHKAKQQCTHIFHVKTRWPACHAPPDFPPIQTTRVTRKTCRQKMTKALEATLNNPLQQTTT